NFARNLNSSLLSPLSFFEQSININKTHFHQNIFPIELFIGTNSSMPTKLSIINCQLSISRG
ncbi:MAG: hypothetical protein KBG70_14160, partial [Chitinophagales bacterium]|nr:hypothetical protein [Chitinophagales bacterium]